MTNTNDSLFADPIEYTIADGFVCAIEYGDTSGLSGSEEAELNDFLDALGSGCWEYEEETYFGTCEVCGYGAIVRDAKFYPHK